MGAFILAGIVLAATLVITAIAIVADEMRDAAGERVPVAAIFSCGLVLSATIAASHWVPHIGW